MTLIVCLDDRNGMMFNNRRQSRDSAVIERICKLSKNAKLFVTPYSKELFENKRTVICSKDFSEAGESDFCFSENNSVREYAVNSQNIIVYRWNRLYPSDCKLDIMLDTFEKTGVYEFKGTSHEKITEEVYQK